MNILVATDGALDSAKAADLVERMYRPGDEVDVLTVINIPLDFLEGLKKSGVREAARIAHEAGHPMASGARAAERLSPATTSGTAKGDSTVLEALAHTASDRTKAVVGALGKRGIEANAIWRTSEHQTAKTILQTIKARDTALLVIGSHGEGRFDGLLGSTGTKLVRQAPIEVLVVRNPPKG